MNLMAGSRETITAAVKQEAKRLGFLHCGVSKADFLEEEAPRLEQWLAGNRHGKMGYMERHFDERLDPRKLVPGAKSVVSLAYNYYPVRKLVAEGEPAISSYAYGEDYHFVIKERLFELLDFIREKIGPVAGRAFVDSAPVLEKAWAARSGLGWVGKNANLISRSSGSFFFLAELVTDLELVPDSPVGDYCGTCNRCMEACPTDAIIRPHIVDGSKCISYFTIELKGELPEEMSGRFGDWVFGCDVCQDVCPWNRFSRPHKEPRFSPSEELSQWKEQDWLEITAETFGRVFGKSALQRTGFEGIRRNLDFRKKGF
ncbi:MAG: tRNA epoxyqueuosine(34) reductase QueG [Bacteroidota bacterium]|jgi:epoxyqueuosine reductase